MSIFSVLISSFDVAENSRKADADHQHAELRELFCLRNQAVVSSSSFFDSFGDA